MNNYLLIAIIVIFLVCIVMGMAKGFVRFAVSIGATVLTILVLIFITPHVSKALIEYTPIDTVIQEGFVGMLVESNTNLTEEELAALEQAKKEGKNLPELTLQQQIEAINQAKLPEFLKDALLDNNNNEVYKKLGVNTFVEYVGAYIAKTVINILAFLITFLIITILIRMTLFSLEALTELPVLHGINRLFGGITGLLLAFVIVWIGFLVITILYGTEFGKACFANIADSKVLTLLYNTNPILKGLLAFR